MQWSVQHTERVMPMRDNELSMMLERMLAQFGN